MVIKDKGIRADEFRCAARAYFLSHLHADHTDGLDKGWEKGPLYCSPVTAKLLEGRWGLNGDVVQTMAPGESRRVEVAGGAVTVRAIEANHCPGAVMFHFAWDDGSVLYTGDFRLNDALRAEAKALAGVDVAYIDVTYDDPTYVFPSQAESIERVVQLVAEHMSKEVFLAIYSVGKTKVLRAVTEEFGLPVYVSEANMKTYRAMGLDHLVTRDRSATNLRGFFRGYYYQYFRYKARRYRKTHAVIIPTGWAADGATCPHGYLYVPYSEHCDYRELCEFRELLQPRQEIAI